MQQYIPLVRLSVVREKSLAYHGEKLNSAENAAKFIQNFLHNTDREYVVTCCTDAKMHPVSVEIIAIGSLQICPLELREALKNAILSNAAYLLLFHTHPSGDPQPSNADVDMTKRIKASGELLGIPLLDHIVLGEGKIYSFRQEGVL